MCSSQTDAGRSEVRDRIAEVLSAAGVDVGRGDRTLCDSADDVRAIAALMVGGDADMTHLLAALGDIPLLEALWAAGVGVDRPTSSGMRPLACAASCGRLWTVQALLEWGAKPGGDAPGTFIPVHQAVYAGVDMVQVLLDAGADVNAFTYTGTTPLHLAAGLGKVAVAELLVRAGADVNAQDSRGNAPLHGAARELRADMIQYLIGQAADANVVNGERQTARDVIAKRTGVDAAICRSFLDEAMARNRTSTTTKAA